MAENKKNPATLPVFDTKFKNFITFCAETGVKTLEFGDLRIEFQTRMIMQGLGDNPGAINSEVSKIAQDALNQAGSTAKDPESGEPPPEEQQDEQEMFLSSG